MSTGRCPRHRCLLYRRLASPASLHLHQRCSSNITCCDKSCFHRPWVVRVPRRPYDGSHQRELVDSVARALNHVHHSACSLDNTVYYHCNVTDGPTQISSTLAAYFQHTVFFISRHAVHTWRAFRRLPQLQYMILRALNGDFPAHIERQILLSFHRRKVPELPSTSG